MPVVNPADSSTTTPGTTSGLGDITGPCADWPVRWICDVSTVSPDITGSAVRVATEVLWALTGRQFGLCQVTLRPCRRECGDDYWNPYFTQFGVVGIGSGFAQPALIGGQWFNLMCGSCTGNTCSCSSISEVKLPAPVHRIVEVKIDGAPLVTGSYRVDDNRLLVRTDGDDWPRCNDLNKSDTEVGTWSVTAEYGQLVPEGGAWAVGELACELINAINGEDCRLPRQVTQLARQGVTITFPSLTELFTNRQTGLYLVDLFIATWNPNKLSRRSGVYSVDGALSRRAGT